MHIVLAVHQDAVVYRYCCILEVVNVHLTTTPPMETTPKHIIIVLEDNAERCKTFQEWLTGTVSQACVKYGSMHIFGH